ncbi:MAG: pyridoxamine 5'-phosphate oxidase [Flavobacteriaceae bacterium]|jgi:pyridoxamine 5'-phosphate oxidase|uniref:Pyridoxine/pyridoxamine 5'-phosphate oxidase n=1 Tax=Flavobacterium kayseriense TaxID=2764714 RepID=A0ABR7JA55_9FLAO|nr:pyridoxamine 5'-phosphate oxidase [Flavobacterium kayseriense]MBC5842395.1 pyridoxamine 5'-phosphate oxidase [Flavobacterium kayseriense]MBC5848925.1 pyridoxamine 5'-phosphate oxidase [Flavobacterium kayseriense]MBX9886804.1 pyridoxamine 5'-phosphate oxidase [Flavobacteriaceae bacterium]
MEDLSNYRKSYEKSELLETSIPEDPINLFNRWFHEVEDFGDGGEVNAMTISTVGADGFPRSRVVLLKKYTEEGFIFYTNYNSDKGKAIELNPHVCLSFFWHAMERQVIIKGIARKVSTTISDSYFESRPDGSKLGAIVSNQSEVVPSRSYLEENLKNLAVQYEGMVIPRPEHWGGYLVNPVEVEFWQGRPNRLHDRIRYIAQDDFSWKIERLSP